MVFGECHMHIFMNGTNYRRAVEDMKQGRMEEVVRRNLESYRKKGITFVRDGGDPYGASVLAKRLAPEYGIDYRTPVFAIHKKGHYGGIVGYGFETMEQYRLLVRAAMENGADFIKIMVSGIMDFEHGGSLSEESLPAADVFEMVHIAHEEGMAVMAHVNGSQAIQTALLAGVDSLEHGNFMDEDCVELLAESRTVYVPTVVTIRNLIGDGRFPEKTLRGLWQRQRSVLKYCFDRGVKLALGSDAGAYCVLHGQGVKDEYQAFCACIGESAKLTVRLLEGEEEIRQKFKRN